MHSSLVWDGTGCIQLSPHPHRVYVVALTPTCTVVWDGAGGIQLSPHPHVYML